MLVKAFIILTAVQGIPSMDLPQGLTQTGPADYAVVHDQSVFAVITDKGGIAAAAAHRHLVVAPTYDVKLTFDEADPGGTRFEFTTRAEELVVDDPDHKATWAARIAELGVTDDLGTVSEGDREKIRKEMLDDDQLDPENHPQISVRVAGVRERAAEGADGDGSGEDAEDEDGDMGAADDFHYEVDVEVTIRGQTVTRVVPASYSLQAGTLEVEALGEFTFKEFGISPYSAFLGAVKVKNEFHMYVRLTAVRG